MNRTTNPHEIIWRPDGARRVRSLHHVLAEIGAWIAMTLESFGLSVAQAAYGLGVHRRTFHRWINGEGITLEALDWLGWYFGCGGPAGALEAATMDYLYYNCPAHRLSRWLKAGGPPLTEPLTWT